MKKILVSIFIGLIIGVSLLTMVLLVLKSMSLQWNWPQLLPRQFSGRAWQYVFLEEPKTLTAIVNSLFIALMAVIINLMVGIPAARYLAKAKVKYRFLMELIIFAPVIVPPFIFIMGIYYFFIKFGLTESYWGVILAHLVPTLPYMIRVLMVSFATLNDDYLNVAKLLGASRLQRYWFVLIPRMLPAIIGGSALTILVSFSQYLLTLLVGGGEILTLPLQIYPFLVEGDNFVGAVYVLLFMVINLGAILVVEKVLKVYANK